MRHPVDAPLRDRLSSSADRLRVLLLTNESDFLQAEGQRDGFTRLEQDGAIESFAWAAPKMIAKSKGESGALREILELVRGKRPNVIVQNSIHGFPVTEDWLRAVTASPSSPILLYWEGDPWGRWSKPPPPETRLWWKTAD